MAQNTKIEWTDHTFNGWTGCTKVSPGCDGCYAEAWAKRSGTVKWGVGEPRRRTTAANWRLPLKWQANAAAFVAQHGRRQRVFCSSLADVFDNAVDPAWRADLLNLIAETPDLDWLLLTKRIGNARAMLDAYCASDGHAGSTWEGWPNVWLGATVVNQEEAARDIPKLLAVPARVRFLSMEPLLGPVDLTGHLWGKAKACADCPRDADCLCGFQTRGQLEDLDGEPALHWVIVGGESGPHARPMHPDWARSLRDQCAEAGVPFLFKQWGEFMPPESPQAQYPGKDWRDVIDSTGTTRPVHFVGDAVLESSRQVVRVGKKAAGRVLDSMTHDAFPTP